MILYYVLNLFNDFGTHTKYLIDKHADVNATQKDGKSALIIACANGTKDIVEILIKAKANINYRTENDTPLIAAARRGHLEIIKLLLDSGADINAMTASGKTALTEAIRKDKQIVKHLIEKGADVNRGRVKALRVAVDYSDLEILRLLLKMGANIEMEGKGHDTNLLIRASRRGNVEICKELIQAGIDVNIKNESADQETPIMIAIDTHNFKLVQYLIQAGADLNVCDYHNDFVLDHAIRQMMY